MLPIVVKQDLHAGASSYSLLLGCIGIGAIKVASGRHAYRKKTRCTAAMRAPYWRAGLLEEPRNSLTCFIHASYPPLSGRTEV